MADSTTPLPHDEQARIGREESRKRLFEFIEQNWERNQDIPPEEIEAIVDEAVREARRQMREEGQRDSKAP